MVLFLDLFRLFAGVTILSFASYTDWQWRRAPNVLWMILAIVGLGVLAVETVLDPAAMAASWRSLLFIPIFAGVVYGLWYFGLIAGGADAKALMALGVLMPFPVTLGASVPLWAPPVPNWPAALSVFANSLIFFMVIPAAFLVWNFAHAHFRLPHAILGVKRPARRVLQGHRWPREVIDEEGNRSTRYFPSRMDAAEVSALFERVQALGDEKVWVTPKVPFMLPLLAGFVAAFFLGDLMMTGMFRLLGP